jgi:hypothetical protein
MCTRSFTTYRDLRSGAGSDRSSSGGEGDATGTAPAFDNVMTTTAAGVSALIARAPNKVRVLSGRGSGVYLRVCCVWHGNSVVIVWREALSPLTPRTH